MDCRNVNGTSFNAKLVINFPVADEAYLKNVQNKFEQLTKKHTGRSMYVSRFQPKGESEQSSILHLSNKKSIKISKGAVYYDGANIITSAWNTLMHAMTESELAEFLARRLEAMCLENSYVYQKDKILSKIDALKGVFNSNVARVNLLKEEGNEKFAKIYSVIAERNKQAYQNVEKKLAELMDSYKRSYEEIAENDPELLEAFMA